MKKFADAFRGLSLALSHKAVRVQFFLGFLAILGGILIRLDSYEWMAFLICIFSVITAEVFNTCIERLCDTVSPEYDQRIRDIKDLSAGAVLIAALGAFVILCISLFRRLP